MAPIPYTKEELELQAKFDLIKRKRQELQLARAAASPAPATVPAKKRASSSSSPPVSSIELAKRVLASEAKKPKLEKKTKDVRPLEDDVGKPREIKPFVSVLSGGANGARRDYHQRFVSSNRPPSADRQHPPRRRFAFGLDETSAHKSASVQVTGSELTEDLLVNNFGEIGEMDLVKVDATGCRGFVTFKSAEHASKAIRVESLDSQPVTVIQVGPEAIQAADFSKEALNSPWASLAAGVAVQRKDNTRTPKEYPKDLMYDE